MPLTLKNFYKQGWQPGASCVAWYKLEGDANDYSGNGNNATWSGTASYTTLGGKTAATFDTSNYIDTGITAGGYPITIACMFYSTETASNYRTIVGAPMNWTSSGKHIGFCFHDVTKFFARCGGSHDTENNPLTINSNNWYFAAIRIDSGGIATVTLDTTTRTETTSSYNITDKIYIGAGIGNRFNGGIKNVAIWNTSISDDELEEYRKTIMGLL